MIHAERIQQLNDRPVAPGRYVLYWIQASQRESCNHALEYAAEQANALSLPLVATFQLTPEYPQANARHYQFLLEGLAELQTALAGRGVKLLLRMGPPPSAAVELAAQAALVVCDRGYLRHQRRWRDELAIAAPCRVMQVETDAVVPVEVASTKEEYAARTLRPRLHRWLDSYLAGLERRTLLRDSLGMDLPTVDVSDPAGLRLRLGVDESVPPVTTFRGGTSEASRRLEAFLAGPLHRYAAERNDPSLGIESHMSPYLHFGQVSPLEIALRVQAAQATDENRDAYIEELIVRRELSLNFVTYNPRYDTWDALPAWARQTLEAARKDPREARYTPEELAAGRTHDDYWNAAQREMLATGKMHNYMRMYWGKRLLQWTPDPREAFRIALWLNNRYELDGRDPNSFAGVAWCFGKHDRPWARRPIFGTVRTMTPAGLERKFDMPAYIRHVHALPG